MIMVTPEGHRPLLSALAEAIREAMGEAGSRLA